MYHFKIRPYCENSSKAVVSSHKIKLEIEPNETILKLKNKIIKELKIENKISLNDIGISLNKKDIIENGSDILIKDSLLCNGDILYIKLTDSIFNQISTNNNLIKKSNVAKNQLLIRDKISFSAAFRQKEYKLNDNVILIGYNYIPKAMIEIFDGKIYKNQNDILFDVIKAAISEFEFEYEDKEGEVKTLECVIPSNSLVPSNISKEKDNIKMMARIKAYGLASSFFNIHGCTSVENEIKELELVTLSFKIKDYIMKIDSKYKLMNFRLLWKKIIDEFILKLIYSIAVQMKKQLWLSMLSMPEEVIIIILEKIDNPNDRVSLCNTCHQLRTYLNKKGIIFQKYRPRFENERYEWISRGSNIKFRKFINNVEDDILHPFMINRNTRLRIAKNLTRNHDWMLFK